MPDTVTKPDQLPDLEAHLERVSAIELARRSLLGAPVYTVISLIMLVGTPMLMDYGWWSALEALLLIMLGAVRVWFALGFKDRYELIGEKAVVQFSILTALQSLTLGVLAGVVIWKYWAVQEVVLTIVLSAGCVAAGTSALSVRRSAHGIFLACVLAPFGFAVFLVGGLAKAVLILGFLVLMAFLVQDGGQARRVYFQRMKEHFEQQNARRRATIEIQAKKEFIKDIGHEIRSPVNSIIGMTALLLDENLHPRAREIAETIRKSSGALLNLVGNISGSIKPVHEISESQRGSLSLNDYINKVVDLFKSEASAKGIELTSQLEALPENIVFCDEHNLEQVLVNLLANALKFTQQGSISLVSSCQKLPDGELLITLQLSDTGIGIPAESLPTLFDPFSSTGAKVSGKFGGGGLGLPLCKGLVELMGGDIWIESSEGKGTTVSFTVRAELDPADVSWQPKGDLTAKEDLTERPESGRNSDLSLDHPHRILVVDDDDIHRQIVTVQLKKMGYQADEAADGEEAIAAVLRGSYDLIFMDLRMPNMSGFESSKWIRERFDDDGDNVRIIALTGDTTTDAREQCIRAGMDNFITKPVQAKDLEAVLRHSAGCTEGSLRFLH